jgi:hypothetical protein
MATNALVENLQTAMREAGVPFAAQNRLLAKLAPMSGHMVERLVQPLADRGSPAERQELSRSDTSYARRRLGIVNYAGCSNGPSQRTRTSTPSQKIVLKPIAIMKPEP